MTPSEKCRGRVDEALEKADQIRGRVRETQFRLKIDWPERIVVAGEDGRPLTESQLTGGPTALKQAWSDLTKGDRLVRIALYYRLFLSDEVFTRDEALTGDDDTLAHLDKEREWAVVDIFGGYDEEERKPSKRLDFTYALQVYIQCLENVEPKLAARLRRAIRAGCLDVPAHDLLVEGQDPWLWQVLNLHMPTREFDHDNDAVDFNDANGARLHRKDEPLRTVEAQRFVLRDRKGRVRAEMGTLGQAGPRICISSTQAGELA